jgi:hypothetical protein
MGLKEDIKEMYHRLGIMEERIRQLQNLDIPKKADITKDLGKAKDPKDFDKKKKEWQTKVDKADAALKDADSYIDTFADQVKKVRSGGNAFLYFDDLKQIDAQIKIFEDTNEVLKKVGNPPLFAPKIKELNDQRQQYIDKQKALYNEIKKEVDSMWKLMDDNMAKFSKVKNGDLADDKEALKTAKFGSGAKVKAGAK